MANISPKVVRTYYQNGEVMEEYYTVNGNIEGICNIYDNNCVIWFCSNYVGGFNHGESKEYHVNGNIKKVCNYLYANLNGDSKLYNKEGILCKYLIYHDDEIVKRIL